MEAVSIQSESDTARRVRKLRVTQRRIDANRRNAARSTGPRTPEGKAKVRLNALRHGFRARDETCIAAGGEEARREIQTHIDKLSREIRPQNPEQERVVSDLAHALWKLRRVHEISGRSRWWVVREDPHQQRENLRFLAGMIRYERRASREMHRALDAIDEIERARRGQNERTKPLVRSRAGGPGLGRRFCSAEGVAPPPPLRLEGGAGKRAHSENERTKPLVRGWVDSTAAAPARRVSCEKESHEPRASTSPADDAGGENERTKPLAAGASRGLRPTLSELTFRFWEAHRSGSRSTRWEK